MNRELPATATRTPVLDLALGVLSVCALVITGLLVKRELFPAPPAAAEQAGPVRVANWRTLAAGGRRIGPNDALVTITTFSDFQCPYCADLARSLVALRESYGDRMAVVYRHFPLRAIHPHAVSAAIAAECAAAQGHFAPFHDLVFARQDSIGVIPWPEFGRRSGVTRLSEFSACLSSPEPLTRVERDASLGEELRVTGTPTVLVNDLRLRGTPSQRQLDSLVQQALSR